MPQDTAEGKSMKYTESLNNEVVFSGPMDLLMNVELPVSILFGRIQMPFESLLQLTVGSLLELDRAADDPVEILVNEKVIARGQIVLVDGNYAVRVDQIVTPRERLARDGQFASRPKTIN
jgi:flagellar motor switch protein FliN/FliY